MTRVSETMPEFTTDKNFINVYALVADLGGEQSMFLQDLKSFHQRFVNPQLRKARLEAFASANVLPIEMPHLKVASSKHVYVDVKVSHGYCASVSLKVMKALVETAEGRAASVVAEQILRFFHVDCNEVLKKNDGGFIIKFLGNLDKDIFGKLINTEPSAVAESAVRACGASYHKRLLRSVGDAKVPK